MPRRWFFFFFQAEDGIRDGRVTGVQTCALPIYLDPESLGDGAAALGVEVVELGREDAGDVLHGPVRHAQVALAEGGRARRPAQSGEIGRASCRERVEISGGGGSLKEKRESGGPE